MIRYHLICLLGGFLIDCIVGDPYWLPHPIRWAGTLISMLEKLLRSLFPATKRGERIAGTLEVIIVLMVSACCCGLALRMAYFVSKVLFYIVSVVLSAYMLAARSLRDESMKVSSALQTDGLESGRRAVSMIVGRDTACLDERGVLKAAVETVAENTSDGVIAPMLCLAVGGPLLAVLYKAVNTMDSMLGYKNDKYIYYGTAAAKLDDFANFFPARISGILMCAAAGLCGMDAKGAWRIFRRDRLAHKSPNSAHTEAACAGALNVQLAGSSYYFGQLVEKPTIGDDLRPVELADIARANRLMYATSLICLALCSAVLVVLL